MAGEGEFLKFESGGRSPPVPSDSTQENHDFNFADFYFNLKFLFKTFKFHAVKVSCLKVAAVVGVSKKKHCLLYTPFECNSCTQTGTLFKDCKMTYFSCCLFPEKSHQYPYALQ